jgi:hypothetical protein
VTLGVGGVRAIQGLTVVHEPIEQNRSHTEVFGDKKANRVRLMLLGLVSGWTIPFKRDLG